MYTYLSEEYIEEFTMFSPEIKEAGKYITVSKFPVNIFKADLKRQYNTIKIANVFDHAFLFFGTGKLRIHKFFLPEFVYLLTILPPYPIYSKVRELIYRDTWMANTVKNFSSIIDYSAISKMLFTPMSHQKKFIDLYQDRKQKFLLNGYILAFDMGLGKTATSLFLMEGLHKDVVIIIAPKSTLLPVWSNEIDNIFKDHKEKWLPFDRPKPADFFIVNYESIDKLKNVLPYLRRAKNVGIVVDECHNFRNAKTKRVQNLKKIADLTNCKDILLMSGTPIKALGTEIIPVLELIDPFFDDESKVVFKKAFGVNVPVALDIVKNRLGIMMHRKLKTEVLKLPKKFIKEIKIKISNGMDFTLVSVKKQVMDFIVERKAYYAKNMYKYRADYNECIVYLRSQIPYNDPDFVEYRKIVDYLTKKGYDRQNQKVVEKVAWANNYEKEVLRPLLTSELKKKFDKSKSAVKYVDLKIMGEVIGGLLSRLRVAMFKEMINNSPTCKIINDAKKKTVMFTTYVDVLKEANSYLRRKCKKDPILIYGDTSKNIKTELRKFKADETINPLVATIQTLSTGVTLVEANTVIFINKPWRDADMQQATDRIYRIGQTDDVYIYTYTLDTGNEPNLSTRMDDILAWSKEMFEGIVGEKEAEQVIKRLAYRG